MAGVELRQLSVVRIRERCWGVDGSGVQVRQCEAPLFTWLFEFNDEGVAGSGLEFELIGSCEIPSEIAEAYV